MSTIFLNRGYTVFLESIISFRVAILNGVVLLLALIEFLVAIANGPSSHLFVYWMPARNGARYTRQYVLTC